VAVVYSEYSYAAGALLILVFLDNSGTVDFTKSAFLLLDGNTSLDYILPFQLYPGRYKLLVSDIEHNGILDIGVGYPAVNGEFIISCGFTLGEYVIVLCTNS
jgi:hypothetical protein